MNNELKKNIDYMLECLGVADKYEHACHVLNFDMETICPEKSMEEQGEIMAFLSNKAFQVIKEDAFIQAEKYVFDHMDQLDGFEKVMATLGILGCSGSATLKLDGRSFQA